MEITVRLFGVLRTVLLAFGFYLPSIAFADPTICYEWKSLKFVRIPAGDFWMGANVIDGAEVGYRDERPRHKVALRSFCIMRERLNPEQARTLSSQFGTSFGEVNDDSGYVIMTWTKARRLADALTNEIGKKVRLATEPEWEFAARGGLENKEFPWGNLDDSYDGKLVRNIVMRGRNACTVRAFLPLVRDTAIKTCIPKGVDDYTVIKELSCVDKLLHDRVPESIPNRYGLITVANNDWEWTSSKYMPYPYSEKNGREDPGISRSGFRVIRGGTSFYESCKGYTSLRGYAVVNRDYESSYHVRFVLEE
jgi:formylglycine-generating enzyme required for sulfatase activity